MFIGGRLYNKGKNADEENPKGSINVTPKSSQEGEEFQLLQNHTSVEFKTSLHLGLYKGIKRI